MVPLHRMDLTINSKLSWPICGCPEITQELNLSRHSFPGSYFCQCQLSGGISNEFNCQTACLLSQHQPWSKERFSLLHEKKTQRQELLRGLVLWLCLKEERLGSGSSVTCLGSTLKKLYWWGRVTPGIYGCSISEESELINFTLSPTVSLCLVQS